MTHTHTPQIWDQGKITSTTFPSPYSEQNNMNFISINSSFVILFNVLGFIYIRFVGLEKDATCSHITTKFGN